jgi:hypothetical protein
MYVKVEMKTVKTGKSKTFDDGFPQQFKIINNTTVNVINYITIW